MKKPKTKPVTISIDSAKILESVMGGLSAAVSRRMAGYVESAMKAEAERVKADVMKRMPVDTGALRYSGHSGKGGLFGTKADFMIIDDPAQDHSSFKVRNNTPEAKTVQKIMAVIDKHLNAGGPLYSELWLTPEQAADVATHTRSDVPDNGSTLFGMTVRIDYTGGSMVEAPYIVAPAPKAEPMSGVADAIYVGASFGTLDLYGAGAVRKPQDAFTKPEGRKADPASEVPVVASAGRFVEVPEE